MSEYKRVIVTARDLPQIELATEFMSIDGNGFLGSPGETITLIASPAEVREFIQTTGEQDGWAEYVENIETESLGDVSDLPETIRHVVEGITPRVFEFAAELVPDGEALDDYWWQSQGCMRFTCTKSSIDLRNAPPARVEHLESWLADPEFAFDKSDANPTNDSASSGIVFEWSAQLSDAHPEAEMRFIGQLAGPSRACPHGRAFIDGIAVTMRDGGDLTEAVKQWTLSRFDESYDSSDEAGADIDSLVSRSDETMLVAREDREWIRVWWD